MFRTTPPTSTIRKIPAVRLSITDFFSSFTTALKISTQTQTCTPEKVSCTHVRWEKLVISPANREMMTREGNTTPSVAVMPPATPRSFWPIKVAVFTAMMPGVHWPMAK